MNNHSIGKTIAELRKIKGWTQAELAEKLNVSDKAVSKWESESGLPEILQLPTMASLFELYANPKCGDIVIFKHGGVFTHTGIVISVSGDYFTTVEGNTSGGSAIIANGGGVCKKGYYNSKLPGTKFCRPNYDLIKEDLTMAQYEELKNEITQLTETVKVLATELSNLKHPMIYNYIDKNMPEWARSAVSWAVENGILNGDENGLNLDDKDLRFITMMYRMRK